MFDSAVSTASDASRGAPAGALDQAGGHAFRIVEQHLQQVLGRELLMALAERLGLRGLDEAPRPLRVFLEIHRLTPFRPASRPEASATRPNSAYGLGAPGRREHAWGNMVWRFCHAIPEAMAESARLP